MSKNIKSLAYSMLCYYRLAKKDGYDSSQARAIAHFLTSRKNHLYINNRVYKWEHGISKNNLINK